MAQPMMTYPTYPSAMDPQLAAILASLTGQQPGAPGALPTFPGYPQPFPAVGKAMEDQAATEEQAKGWLDALVTAGRIAIQHGPAAYNAIREAIGKGMLPGTPAYVTEEQAKGWFDTAVRIAVQHGPSVYRAVRDAMGKSLVPTTFPGAPQLGIPYPGVMPTTMTEEQAKGWLDALVTAGRFALQHGPAAYNAIRDAIGKGMLPGTPPYMTEDQAKGWFDTAVRIGRFAIEHGPGIYNTVRDALGKSLVQAPGVPGVPAMPTAPEAPLPTLPAYPVTSPDEQQKWLGAVLGLAATAAPYVVRAIRGKEITPDFQAPEAALPTLPAYPATQDEQQKWLGAVLGIASAVAPHVIRAIRGKEVAPGFPTPAMPTLPAGLDPATLAQLCAALQNMPR